MTDDRRRPDQYPSRRDEVLARWLAEEVRPFSRAMVPRLVRAGLDSGRVDADRLAALDVVDVAALGDGRDWLLEPDEALVRAGADLVTRARLVVGDVLGTRAAGVRDDLGVRFRPVVWSAAPGPRGTLFTAATTEDLDVLAALGRRALAISGLVADDTVLLGPVPGVSMAAWQLESGCIDAGVAVLRGAASPDALAAAAPTVVAGELDALAAMVDDLPASVGRMLVLSAAVPDDEALAALAARTGVAVVPWWSPPGTRAAWARCAVGGGFHTWPEHELIEILDDADRPAAEGRVVWSAVGWRGTVWLRVDLGVRGRLDGGACACGRTTPRVVPLGSPSTEHRVAAALDGLDDLVDWIVAVDVDGGASGLLVRPRTRSSAPAVRAGAQERTGLATSIVAPARFTAIRDVVGVARVAEVGILEPLVGGRR